MPSIQGTTTNGRYLLNFKTGAFLAGLPLQPVIIKYDLEVSALLSLSLALFHVH
jgi:hypothetical protein